MNRFKNRYPLAGLPVIVMLAMAPMAEGKQPAQFIPIDSEHLTEVLAQANSVAPKAYEYAQSPEKTAPLGVPYFALYGKIQEHFSCKANGENATLVFHTPVTDPSKLVNHIHFVEKNYKNDKMEAPPYVADLIYHDLGEGKEFCSIKVIHKIRNNKGQTLFTEFEYKLDDNSAQKIIDLIAGDSKWTNRTNIKFSETTSPNVAPPKVIWVEE